MGALVTLLADHLFERVVRVRTSFFQTLWVDVEFRERLGGLLLGRQSGLGCCARLLQPRHLRGLKVGCGNSAQQFGNGSGVGIGMRACIASAAMALALLPAGDAARAGSPLYRLERPPTLQSIAATPLRFYGRRNTTQFARTSKWRGVSWNAKNREYRENVVEISYGSLRSPTDNEYYLLYEKTSKSI
mgnify:CR=1 FL=1